MDSAGCNPMQPVGFRLTHFYYFDVSIKLLTIHALRISYSSLVLLYKGLCFVIATKPLAPRAALAFTVAKFQSLMCLKLTFPIC